MTSNDNIYICGPVTNIMANELVSIRMPGSLLEESRNIADSEGYANVQEFIREAIRDHIRTRKLHILYGSAKGKSVKSREEWEKELKRKHF